jgi:hypothetical protein
VLNFKTKINFDESGLKKKQKTSREKAQLALDQQVIKDSNYYAPERDHNLQDSALLHSRPGKGHIEWRTPYARRLYYNPEYNFSKDKNPNAGGLWFEIAKRINVKKWAEIAGVSYKKIFNGK